jgi:micrococcal nuclease
MKPYYYNAIVRRVVDGDTVILDIDLGFNVILYNQSVRLKGVDTPECRTRNSIEKKAGLLAKKKVEEFLGKGDRIVIKTSIDKKGKFGRILGVIQTDKTNVNDFLIENNYAVLYHGQSKNDVWNIHLENFKKLEERGELL